MMFPLLNLLLLSLLLLQSISPSSSFVHINPIPSFLPSQTYKISSLPSSSSSKSKSTTTSYSSSYSSSKLKLSPNLITAASPTLTPPTPETIHPSYLKHLTLHTLPSQKDLHPLTLYSLTHQHTGNNGESDSVSVVDKSKPPLLLLHGRTWSSLSVYHVLTPGDSDALPTSTSTKLSSSTLINLSSTHTPYLLDFRSFGLTPSDATGKCTPGTCVQDVVTALDFISSIHGGVKPSLLGWSQGSLVALLTAQGHADKIRKLVLYASIYDPGLIHPPALLQNSFSKVTDRIPNTLKAALEDFTVPHTITDDMSRAFGDTAIVADNLKGEWSNLHEFNHILPSKIPENVGCLVIAGDRDGYTNSQNQHALYNRLQGGNNRHVVINDADHCVHMLDGLSGVDKEAGKVEGKVRWLNEVNDFLID